jgi:hypothetical protein
MKKLIIILIVLVSVNISDNKKSANGWLVCECEVDGKWISTFNL